MSAAGRDLGRVLTAMVTPFGSDGALDLDRAEKLAAFLIESGNDGLVAAGTTGESPTLTHQEKLDLFRAVRSGAGKATVVAGTGTNDTKASIDMSREALKLGVDAVLAVVPYYNRPPQKSLYAHFSAIAKSVDGPVVMYNIPSRSVVNMTPETTARLSEIDNIVALKEANTDLTHSAQVAASVAQGFLLYSGEDSLTLPMLAVGFHGVVSVAGHFAPAGIQQMIGAFVDGQPGTALELHQRLLPLFRQIFCTTSPIPTKAALQKLGVDCGECRLPLSGEDLQPAQLDELLRIVRELGPLAADFAGLGKKQPALASTTA